MRKQKFGIIVNMSSVAGRFGLPTQSAYVSTKFAIEGLSESHDPNSPYSQLMHNVAGGFEHILEGASSSDVVAKAVLKAVTTENPSLRHLAGKDAEIWMKEKSSMSDAEFYKMMKGLCLFMSRINKFLKEVHSGDTLYSSLEIISIETGTERTCHH
jgi:hypothetical protein